jgi:RNA polymerase subunit RPABC4/transcription elongation factor Spt4
MCGYHGCGKVSAADRWKYRKGGRPKSKPGETFYGGDPLICPDCGKAATDKEINEYNYWTIVDPKQRSIAKKILAPKF